MVIIICESMCEFDFVVGCEVIVLIKVLVVWLV